MKALEDNVVVYDLAPPGAEEMKEVYEACTAAVSEEVEEPTKALDTLPAGVGVVRATTASDPGYLVPNVVMDNFDEWRAKHGCQPKSKDGVGMLNKQSLHHPEFNEHKTKKTVASLLQKNVKKSARGASACAYGEAAPGTLVCHRP